MATSTRGRDPAREEEFLGALYKGGELLAAGNLAEAKDHLEKAHGLDPKNEKAQNLLGLTYFKLGDYPQASAVYSKLVDDNPTDATLRVNLGLVFLKTNDLERCVHEFETATDLEPTHKKAHNYLGLALAQQGNYVKAKEHFELAGSDAMVEKMTRAIAAQTAATAQTVEPHAPKTVRLGDADEAPPPPPPPVAPENPPYTESDSIEVMSDEELPSDVYVVPEDAQAASPPPEAANLSADWGAQLDAPPPVEELPVLDAEISTTGETPLPVEDAEVPPPAPSAPAPAWLTMEAAEASRVDESQTQWVTESVEGVPPPGEDSVPAAMVEDIAAGVSAEAVPASEESWASSEQPAADDASWATSEQPAVEASAETPADGASWANSEQPAVEASAETPADDASWATSEQPAVEASAEAPADDASWATGEQPAVEASAETPADDASWATGEPPAVEASAETPADDASWATGEPPAVEASAETPADDASWATGEPPAVEASVETPADDASWATGEQPAVEASAETPADDSSWATGEQPAVEASAETPADDASWATGEQQATEAPLPTSADDDSWATGATAAAAEQPATDDALLGASKDDASWTEPAAPEPSAPLPITVEEPEPAPAPVLAGAPAGYAPMAPQRLVDLGASGAWVQDVSTGPFHLSNDGLAVTVTGEMLLRMEGLVAVVGSVEVKPETRRRRGRTTQEPFGKGAMQLQRVAGHGTVYLEPGKAKFHAVDLTDHNGVKVDDDGAYLREEYVFAFEEPVSFENGRLTSDSQLLELVHLKGTGRVLLQLDGNLRAMPIPVAAPLVVPLHRVVGWFGRVTPRLTGFGGRGAVELTGEGYALLGAPPERQ